MLLLLQWLPMPPCSSRVQVVHTMPGRACTATNNLYFTAAGHKTQIRKTNWPLIIFSNVRGVKYIQA